MKKITAIVLLILILACVSVADAQVCGDFNIDGSVNIADYIGYITFMCFKDGAPPPGNWSWVDVDHRDGLTVGDLNEFGRWLWTGTIPSLTCNITGEYSFAPTSDDTVFVPRMLSVPEGIDKLYLPVKSNLGSNVGAVYLPFVKSGPSSNGLFGLTKVTIGEGLDPSYVPSSNQALAWDTLTPYLYSSGSGLVGARTLFTLEYTRNSAGTGSVAPLVVDRNEQWKPTIVRNGDLFLPVVQYYDYVVPPDTLSVSLGSMSFDAVAGFPSTDSFVVSFTSSGLPITFELTPTEPWITVVDTGAVGFSTPADVVIKADATSTGIGNYTGKIQFTNLSPAVPTTIPEIGASFAVRAPNTYPPGDIDCDGIVDISDLTKLIDHLFLSILPLTPCQQ